MPLSTTRVPTFPPRAGLDNDMEAVRTAATLAVAVACCVGGGPAWAGKAAMAPPAKVEFDAALLFGGAQGARDLSGFSSGNPMTPGTYRVVVWLNGARLGRMNVELRARSAKATNATPCFDARLLSRFNLDLAKVSPKVRALLVPAQRGAGTGNCVRIDALAAAATAHFNAAEERLDITIPQPFLVSIPHGYIPPADWNRGIDAGLLTYRFNSDMVDAGGVRTVSNNLALTAGVNMRGWMLRHDGILDATMRTTYHAVDTYVRHDIPALRAALTAGDGNTDGQVFDSIGFRGAMVATDDRMLAPSQRGFAPVIRGVARSNATVTVTQNGVLLDRITVPPGPFEINDLYPPGMGGSLLVTVKEADGAQRTFSVPYFASAQLLRAHGLRYQAVVGMVRGPGMPAGTPLVLGTAQYGVLDRVTLLGGGVAAAHYGAFVGGVAFDTPVGAIGGKVGVSSFDDPGAGVQRGVSVEATYGVVVPRSSTSIALDVRRAASPQAYTLQDAMTVLGQAALAPAAVPLRRERASLNLNLTQPLGQGATLVVSAISQAFWNTGRTTQYQIGCAWNMDGALVQVALNRDRVNGVPDTQASVSMSMPLGRTGNAGTAGLNVVRSSQSGDSLQATYSNTAGAHRALNYTLQSGASANGGASVGAYGTWNTSLAALTASTTNSATSTQWSFGASGGLILHAGGVTFGPPLGDTVGLIHAPAAAGVPVLDGQQSRVDAAGYAVVPWLSPYERDDVALDLSRASMDIDMDATHVQVIPRADAVVMIPFGGRTAHWVLISAVRADGSGLPFGADVDDAAGRLVGNVGQGGRIDARVRAASGLLWVRWGPQAAQGCRVAYTLPAHRSGPADILRGLRCEPLPMNAASADASR